MFYFLIFVEIKCLVSILYNEHFVYQKRGLCTSRLKGKISVQLFVVHFKHEKEWYCHHPREPMMNQNVMIVKHWHS